MSDIDFRVIEAYLVNSWSHRNIQEVILKEEAPTRGGGFKAMTILHKYGITGDYKGILASQTLDKNLFEKCNNIDEYLQRLK